VLPEHAVARAIIEIPEMVSREEQNEWSCIFITFWASVPFMGGRGSIKTDPASS
jgi:hypothetical protein